MSKGGADFAVDRSIIVSDPDFFDIKFSLLPPELQVKLWVLALDANTSKVSLAYSLGAFRTSLAYNYGGNLEASLGRYRLGDPLVKVGFNPSNSDLSAGLVFRGFNFGTSANVTRRTFGFNVGYGRDLLPFPAELDRVFNAANGGLMSMASDIRSAPDNPLRWYNLHSNDTDAISRAVSTGQQIANSNKGSQRFGAALGLTHTAQTGLTIHLGVGVFFWLFSGGAAAAKAFREAGGRRRAYPTRRASTPAPGAVPARGRTWISISRTWNTAFRSWRARSFEAFFIADHMAMLNMPLDALKRSHTMTSFEPFTLLSSLAVSVPASSSDRGR
jgi:hypothetical protein